MSGNEEVATCFEGGQQGRFEVGQRSGGTQFQGFTLGGWDVVRAAPKVDLFVTVLLAGGLLVQALEVTVHAFVELPRHVHGKDVGATRFPADGRPLGHAAFVLAEPLQTAFRDGVLHHRDAATVVLGQGQHGGHLRANEGGHVDFVDRQVGDLLPAFDGLLDADVGEGHVDPAGEAVGRVPHRLAMTHEDEQGHGTHVDHRAVGHEASHDAQAEAIVMPSNQNVGTKPQMINTAFFHHALEA